MYRARGRTAEPEDFEEEQPTTRLSTAFIVVVALHLVLVGGIYAFNSIKANRPTYDAPKATVAAAPKQTAEPIEKAAPQNVPVATTQAKAPSNPVLPIGNSRIHQVKAGDTLTKIAQLHGVTTGELAEANGLKETAILRPGQSLNVPAPHVAGATRSTIDARKEFLQTREETAPATGKKAASSPAKVIPKTHTIAKNETLTAIVRKYGVSYDELIKLNKIEDPKKLQIGTVLKLPQPKTASN